VALRNGVLAVVLGVLTGGLALAAPASAHTGVDVEPKVAGSANALVTVSAAAESTTAGITSLKVVLPEGIAPADVTYVSGPAGWSMQPDAEGYVVAGPAVAVGRDAVHEVRVKQLPLTPSLVFKVLQTYTDGRIDRWIEVPSGANAEPEYPAPVVQLAAPPGGFPGGAASGPAPAPTDHGGSASSATAGPAVDPATPVSGEDGSALPWLILGVAVLAVIAAGAVLWRRRAGSRPAA
jgi:uncharacterized protein YcnI